MPRQVFDEEIDIMEELESLEDDDEVLQELSQKRKERQKSFLSVINKKKLSKHELDEVML